MLPHPLSNVLVQELAIRWAGPVIHHIGPTTQVLGLVNLFYMSGY
jgi:hypothetical protein